MSSFNFQWVATSEVLEATLDPQQTYLDTKMISEEIRQHIQDRGIKKAHLMLDVSRFDFTPRNRIVLTTLLLPLFIDELIDWCILYGTDRKIMSLMGSTLTFSIRGRMRSAPERTSAIDKLREKGVYIQLA
ncbi:MAG: hypothetical protein AAFV93_19310 [Chloroflexota bacterium]